MISRTLNWISRYLDLTAEEQVVPRTLESINPTLSIPLEYFWETVGPTVRENFVIDHDSGDIEQIAIPFKDDLDTLLIDFTWINNGGANGYFINWDLLDINKVSQTTLWRENINGGVSPSIVTRTTSFAGRVNLVDNSYFLPRLIRNTEELRWFVDDGGVGANANELVIRTVSFPKGGPLPRLAF